jgi:hypothetical protein
MFSIGTLYTSACSNAMNLIRIFPILMSIVFHHYKILTEKNFFFHSSSGFDFSLPSSDGGWMRILMIMIKITMQQQY